MRAARERRTADVEPTRRASSRRPELPLYYRIYKTVEERIDRNHYGVGDRLPSEDDLCREFGVSRITIREAISRLVDEGLVVRRRGSGTFVAQHREKRAFKEITFTGGVSRNTGMVRALGAVLGKPINVSDDGHYMGALGAALFALERAQAAARGEVTAAAARS